MVDGDEAGGEDTADVFDILEGEGCLGELAIGYLGIDHLVDHRGDRGLGELIEATRACLDGICHHEDRPFFGAGFGARVAEERFIDLLFRMGVTIGIVEIAHEGRTVVGGDEIDDHLGQMVATGYFLSFGDMRHDDLCGISGIHLKERVLHAGLVLYIVERVGYLTYIVVECARSHEECVGADGLGSFGREVRHLHRVLEGTRGTFGERVKQFGVDIRQFDEGDGRDKTEQLLEAVYQTVATDGQQAADREMEVHPRVDGRPCTGLGEGDSGVSDRLGKENPRSCLDELCAACHVSERGDSYHADDDLDEEELNRRRHHDGRDEDGGEMQEESRSGVKEDTRQDGYPCEGDEIDGQAESECETCECNDDEHLQRKEKHRGGGMEIRTPEDVKVHHKETEEERDQHRLAEDGEGALFVAERLIVVRAAEGVEDLVIALSDHFALVDDLLPFLDESLRGRESCQQFGAQFSGADGVEHEVDGTVVAEALVRGHRCVDLRQRVFLLLERDTRVALGLQPIHSLEGDNLHFALHVRDIIKDRCEGREQLGLLLGQLFVGLVYGEIEIRREGVVAPGFADLVVVAEGVVIAREHQHDDCGKEGKDA